MDFEKLVHVTDGLVNPSKRSISAPKSLPKSGSVLDKITVDEKAADKGFKVMILDDTQIVKIMTASRDDKRKMLSRLTDSQRRRLLSRYREITKVKDDSSVDVLSLVTLDALLNNVVFTSGGDDYNKTLLEQWESAYTVPEAISDFVEAVKSGDSEGMQANFDSYKDYCESQGVKSVIETLNPTTDVPVDVPGEPAQDLVEDAPQDNFDEGIPELDDLTEEDEAAIGKAATVDCLRYLAGDCAISRIDDSITDLSLRYNARFVDVANVYSTAWDKQWQAYQTRVRDSQDNKLGMLVMRKVMDDIIDEIADKPLLDQRTGEEVKTEDERPILEVLSEALEAYVSGDSTLLDQIATTTLGGDSTEEPETEKEAELEQENEDLKDTLEDETDEDAADVVDEHKEEESEESSSPVGDSSQLELECPDKKLEEAAKEQERSDKENAKELAKLLKMIEKGTECGEIKDSLNALIDSLSSKVPTLRKYNFKISDCYPVCGECEAPVTSVNMPLSRTEYYDMCPVIPECFDLVVAQYGDKQLCPNCSEYQVNENGLCVNPNTTAQMYYPYGCSLEELASLLGAAQQSEYTDIINKNCCPMGDAMKVAALTNNLGFIDNTFYKRHVGDSEWVFDSVPACLQKFTDKPGSIKLVMKATDSSIELFGQHFEIK